MSNNNNKCGMCVTTTTVTTMTTTMYVYRQGCEIAVQVGMIDW